MTEEKTGPLAGLRVLEIPGPFGEYAGKLFADLGAEVLIVEPPTGAPGRSRPPFLDDAPDPERSLWFGYFNTSKRSVVLDLDSEVGRGSKFELVLPTLPV